MHFNDLFYLFLALNTILFLLLAAFLTNDHMHTLFIKHAAEINVTDFTNSGFNKDLF